MCSGLQTEDSEDGEPDSKVLCSEGDAKVFRISMAQSVIIPPISEMLIPGVVEGKPHFTHGIVEPRDDQLFNGNVAMWQCQR